MAPKWVKNGVKISVPILAQASVQELFFLEQEAIQLDWDVLITRLGQWPHSELPASLRAKSHHRRHLIEVGKGGNVGKGVGKGWKFYAMIGQRMMRLRN